jgi:MFS family permease
MPRDRATWRANPQASRENTMTAYAPAASSTLTKEGRLVIFASSLGTVFEWYDFYLYGTLAAFFSALFFPSGNETAAFLASLATFGAGFMVRPFGALVFGRIGDLVGRKYTFLITIVIMGGSTAAVGLMPTYTAIGVWAPILLVTLRLLQGLALGGEYGGAATYVAEHAPHHQRGLDTSWIQTTATLGFFLSLAVIAICRLQMDAKSFAEWGWRIPFLVSVVLLGISVWIRLKLSESPVFTEMKRQGKGSKAPLTDSFAKWSNARYVLLALFGATAGQGVVWYTGQFYALFFITATLKVDYLTGYTLIALSLLIGTPFFVFFGWLSDKIGRKPIMMAGCLLGAVTFIPIFQGLTHYANPALEMAQANNPVVVEATNCNFNIFAKPSTKCDLAKDFLSKAGIGYTSVPAVGSDDVVLKVGGTEVKGFDAKVYAETLKAAGYPLTADKAQMNQFMVVVLLTVLMLYVTMVYGPIAAFLVELFPTRVRYTSMSLPYHIGNGWFGGLLPFLTFAIVVYTGNIYSGLWYPIAIAVMTLVVGTVLIRETTDNNIHE